MVEAASRNSRQPPELSGRISVCHVASGDLWAGAEVQIATLIKYLAKEDNIRLSALLLNHGRLAEEIERLGVETMVIPESQTGFFGVLRRAEDILRFRKTHILHSHRYKENILAAFLARKCNVSVLVRTQHGLPEPRRGLKGMKQAVTQSFDRMTARWSADRIIGVSSDVSQRLRRQYGPDKIVTIPSGVDVENVRSRFSAAEAKQHLGIPEDNFVVGSAGRLEPIKRLDIFLKAAKQISAQLPCARFVLAGDGGERSNLMEFAFRLGIGERVHFLGHRDDIYDVLRAFDLLVLSSDHEGLPMVLLEAMALGVAVVARAVGGIPEVIRDGKNGVLVNTDDAASLANACCHVLEDPAWRQRMTESARISVAEGYTAEQTANQVRQLYYSLLSLQ